MTYKTVTTELYDKTPEGWYITVKRTTGSDNNAYYTFEKENSSDGRSRTSFQVDEVEMSILYRLLKEILEEEE